MKLEDNNWKIKFQSLFNQAQTELKRTTAIGKKMLSASQSNTQLKETYEKLGQLTLEAIKSGELKWQDSKVRELMNKVNQLEEELKKLEEEVQKIKKD